MKSRENFFTDHGNEVWLTHTENWKYQKCKMHLIQANFPVCCRGSTIPWPPYVADWVILTRNYPTHWLETQAKARFRIRVHVFLDADNSCAMVKLENHNSNHLQPKVTCTCSRNGSHYGNIQTYFHMTNFPFDQHSSHLEAQSLGSNRKFPLE